MRSFSIFVFLLLWSGASYGSPFSCAAENFQFTAATSRNGEGKVEKKGCILRFLTFLGKGEKIEVNVCQGETVIQAYADIVAPEPKTLPAGSANCPLPLFGADFSVHGNNADEFVAAKARIMWILKDVKRRYVPPGTGQKGAHYQVAAAQFACLESILTAYLEECTSLDFENSEK